MTDQLESDLRNLLRDRAEAVTVDAGRGEAEVARRLSTGDAAMADVISLDSPRRQLRLVAAAALLVIVVGATVAAFVLSLRPDREQQVATELPVETPSIFSGTGDSIDVALAYLVDRLEMSGEELELREVPSSSDEDPQLTRVLWTFSELGFAEHRPLSFPIRGFVVLRHLSSGSWQVTESYSDAASIDEVSRTGSTITVRSTGPAASFVQLGVHRLSGEAMTSGGCGGQDTGSPGLGFDTEPVECSIVDEQIPFTDEAVTVRLSVVTVDGEPLTIEERLVEPVEP